MKIGGKKNKIGSKHKLSKKKKIITVVIISIVAIVVAIATALALFILTQGGTAPLNKNEIIEISVSMVPKAQYFVGETFDPTGLEIQVRTNSMDTSYFVKYPNSEIQISGFDSTEVAETLPITVAYKGFTTTFNVTIKEAPQTAVTLKSIRLSDNFYSSPYTVEEWNTYGPIFDNVNLILTYSDGTEKEVPMKSKYCSEVERTVYEAGTTQFLVTYTEEGTINRCTVTVTIVE